MLRWLRAANSLKSIEHIFGCGLKLLSKALLSGPKQTSGSGTASSQSLEPCERSEKKTSRM